MINKKQEIQNIIAENAGKQITLSSVKYTFTELGRIRFCNSHICIQNCYILQS